MGQIHDTPLSRLTTWLKRKVFTSAPAPLKRYVFSFPDEEPADVWCNLGGGSALSHLAPIFGLLSRPLWRKMKHDIREVKSAAGAEEKTEINVFSISIFKCLSGGINSKGSPYQTAQFSTSVYVRLHTKHFLPNWHPLWIKCFLVWKQSTFFGYNESSALFLNPLVCKQQIFCIHEIWSEEVQERKMLWGTDTGFPNKCYLSRCHMTKSCDFITENI